MKKTKKLNISEYPMIYDRQNALLKQVNFEAELLYPKQPPSLPPYSKPKKIKWSVGLYNLSRQILP